MIGFAACVLFVAFGADCAQPGFRVRPRLSEGAIAVNVVRLTGTDLEDSIKYNTQMEKAVLAAFPDEVEHVWSRIGTARDRDRSDGTELTDIFITLKPRKQWTRANTQAELTVLVERELRDLPGQRLVILQPIEMRMNEMVSGIRADVAVKLYGDDLDVLADESQRDRSDLKSYPRQRRREPRNRSPASQSCKSSWTNSNWLATGFRPRSSRI